MKILITGASGLIGAALQNYFPAGYEVRALNRGNREAGKPYWDISAGAIDFAGFEPEAVIHLAGENIAAGRWTDSRKSRILDSRVAGTRLLVDYLLKMENKPHTLLSGSAIGYYGLRGDEKLDEDSAPGEGFVTDVCIPWEAESKPAAEAGMRLVNLRTGVVLSKHGGALTKMLLPFKMGLGGRIGNGHQYMSWISIDDMVNAVDFVLRDESISGPVNMTAPNPVTNTEFTRALGQALHRPTLFPMPAFAATMLFGEMAEELLLGGARVIPKKLLDNGFKFRHPQIVQALAAVLR